MSVVDEEGIAHASVPVTNAHGVVLTHYLAFCQVLADLTSHAAPLARKWLPHETSSTPWSCLACIGAL